MKTTFLFTFLCLLSLQGLQAQDTITKRTGEKVKAEVLEISTTEVMYRLFENLEGPIYIVPKADVMLIDYADKSSEIFELANVAPANATDSSGPGPEYKIVPFASTATSVQFYNQGQTDAATYYAGYKAAGTAVLVTSLLSPLVALVPAIGTSSTPPKLHNLDAPNSQLLQQPDYQTGYRKSARKIKSGKVWKNWGIGLGVNLVLAVMLLK